jgi:hypothetical protein
MNEKSLKEKNLTATERLENVETLVLGLTQNSANMADQFKIIFDTFKAIVARHDALERCLLKAGIVTTAQIESEMSEARMAELKGKVDTLIASGVFSKIDAVNEKSFIVGREVKKESGEVITPRIQVLFSSIEAEGQKQLLGKKAGDQVQFKPEDDVLFEVEEIYEIKDAPASEESASEAPASSEKTA